jgi:Fanconi anemia group M protein
VESLPHIGPVTARKLLEEFSTISGVFNASEEDLKEIDGIGDKIAENIREVIESKYIVEVPYSGETQEYLLSSKNKPEKEFHLKKENQ